MTNTDDPLFAKSGQIINYLIYSLFSATIGNSFEAFKAGNKPARRLSEAEVSHTLVISAARNMGAICD